MRVLFCTDGSKISFNALNNFARWSKGAIIDVICVIDWSFLPDEVSIEEDGFANSCANVADNILNYAEKEIHKTNLIMGDKLKRCGESVASILEQTDREDYEMVIMGSHGKKGLQRWLGSVSRDVINNITVSSYVSTQSNSAKKILFATDGTDNSSHALSEAIKLLNLNQKEIYICVVSENPNFLFLEGTLDTHWLLEIEKQQERFAEKMIRNVITKLEEYNLTVAKNAVLTGIPAEKINDFALKEGIDLIVMGTRHKNNLRSKFHGSVSKRVLEITHSDVIIVK